MGSLGRLSFPVQDNLHHVQAYSRWPWHGGVLCRSPLGLPRFATGIVLSPVRFGTRLAWAFHTRGSKLHDFLEFLVRPFLQVGHRFIRKFTVPPHWLGIRLGPTPASPPCGGCRIRPGSGAGHSSGTGTPLLASCQGTNGTAWGSQGRCPVHSW